MICNFNISIPEGLLKSLISRIHFLQALIDDFLRAAVAIVRRQ